MVTCGVTWETDLLDKTAADIMTEKPKKQFSDTMLAAEALAVMNDNKIQSLFICEAIKTDWFCPLA